MLSHVWPLFSIFACQVYLSNWFPVALAPVLEGEEGAGHHLTGISVGKMPEKGQFLIEFLQKTALVLLLLLIRMALYIALFTIIPYKNTPQIILYVH